MSTLNTETLLGLVRQFPQRKRIEFNNEDDLLFIKQVLLALKAARTELEAFVAQRPTVITGIDLGTDPEWDRTASEIKGNTITLAKPEAFPSATPNPCQHGRVLEGKCLDCGEPAGVGPEKLAEARRKVARARAPKVPTIVKTATETNP